MAGGRRRTSTTADERSRRLRGRPGLGAWMALLLHAAIFVPLIVVVLVLGGRQAAQREQLAQEEAESLDVAWERINPDDLADDLPPIDKAPRPPERAKSKTPTPKDELPEKPEKPDEIVQPTPEQPPPPKPPEPPRKHEKLVDLDNERDDPAPDDAKYLAQKNNRAEVETRARDTNLERESKGEEPGSEPSQRKEETTGGPEARVAQFEKVESQLGRRAPSSKPSATPELERGPADPRRSVLAMREAQPRSHAISPETANPNLPADPDGPRALPHDDLQSAADMPDRDGAAERTKLRLSANDLDYLFGDQVEADRRLAEKRQSQKRGRFSKRIGQVASALENFIPEVQPGNQTALSTRAAPFAAYLAGMHRSIHELWGFGFLWDLDGKPVGDPMNDRNLWTRLEIVLAGDGTVDNVKVIHSSGLTSFDVAAVDVVYSAGPYPDPPKVIRSGNGKIYLHWSFHRDERQCATFGADYYILDNAPAGADRGSAEEASVPLDPRPAAHTDRPDRRLEHLSRADGHRHAHGDAHGEREARPVIEESNPFEARAAEEERPRATDPLARRTAEQFFGGFVAGRAGDMVKAAAFPFRALDGGVAADSAGTLQPQLQALIDEAGSARRLHSLNLYSAAGLRAAIGWAPPHYAADHRLLFAVAVAGANTFVAVLRSHMGAFKVAALVRR